MGPHAMLYMPDAGHVEGVQDDLSGHAAPAGFVSTPCWFWMRILARAVSPFDGEPSSSWFTVCRGTSIGTAPLIARVRVGESAAHPRLSWRFHSNSAATHTITNEIAVRGCV